MNKNQIVPETGIEDLLNLKMRETFMTLNCHAIGKVEKFDPGTQTCSVTINYQKTLYRRETNGNYVPTLVSYPVLVDCPIVMNLGGEAGLTMPIKKGDDCIVFFNDRDLDNWWEGASNGGVATTRMHSLSDAMVFVGLRNKSKLLQNYVADRAVLFYGANKISVGQNDCIIEVGGAKITVGAKIKIEVGGQSLGVLLGNLCTAITANVPLTTSAGNPVNAAAQTAAINLAKTALQGVLE